MRRGGSKKRDLSDLLSNSDESKKPREDSLEDSHVLNSSALGYVFVSSSKAPDALNCMKKVENPLKEMLGLIKSTQAVQIKGESH